jgi:hypothetical protein
MPKTKNPARAGFLKTQSDMAINLRQQTHLKGEASL